MIIGISAISFGFSKLSSKLICFFWGFEDDLFDDFKNLNGRLWSEENKSVFGTSYKHNYIIVTGNIAVLNFLLNQGYEINYIAHRSRCFVSKRYEEKINSFKW